MTREPADSHAKVSECWCCPSQHPADALIMLGCHDEVALCGGFVDWLADRHRGRPLRRAVPILATNDVTPGACSLRRSTSTPRSGAGGRLRVLHP